MLPTGEAFPVALCRRWMKRYPHVRLLNAFGPAECADDVAYHRITTAPHEAESRIPIGRPLPNIRLYVLDRTLHPVPVGVPGELCVAGIGVGRGYLGRPDLTAEVFVPDPFHSAGEYGGRLYPTGDLACYRPDGTLEYLGRIDHQVKVRGFRIEPGEIEVKLLAHPRVEEAIVLAREDSPGDKRLVAYVVAAPSAELPTSADLRAFLKGTLPEHMLPSAFVFLDKLPLNPNGKVDRKDLPAPDVSDQLVEAYVAPRTPTEALLARIWAEVLRIKQLGIYDNFFELGGDSILSLQIVSRARQAGLALTPRQVFDHPQIAELAEAAERGLPQRAEQGRIHGQVALTPIQRWFFEHELSNPHHWNQAVLLKARQRLDPALLKAAIRELLEHHDALRMRFSRRDGDWRQINLAEEPHEVFTVEDLSAVTDDDLNDAMKRVGEHWHATLDLCDGPLMQVVWFDLGPHRAPRLLMVIHHLVVDGVSWRILLEDLHTAYRQLAAGETVSLPAKTTSFRQWSHRLHRYAGTEQASERYWSELAATPVRPLPVENPDGAYTEACTDEINLSLGKRHTQALLRRVPSVYRTRIDEVLLAALARVVCHWSQSDSVWIDLENHGREDLFPDMDLSRTVGWSTSLFPVRLAIDTETGPRALLQSIKEQLRAVPGHGIGYGIQRYLAGMGPESISTPISFNYLGQLDQALPQESLFEPAAESTGACFGPQNARMHEWEIVGYILGGSLHIVWRYGRDRSHRATIEDLCRRYLTVLESLIEHCLSPEAGGCTPSDFPLATLDQAELDSIIDDPRNVEDIYPLGPMQEGLLLHTLMSP
ncbi:MAG: condensation domain-containing protein, partial [Anaerolineales bacterium]